MAWENSKPNLRVNLDFGIESYGEPLGVVVEGQQDAEDIARKKQQNPKDHPLSICVLYFYFPGHHIDTLTASLYAFNYVVVYVDLVGA